MDNCVVCGKKLNKNDFWKCVDCDPASSSNSDVRPKGECEQRMTVELNALLCADFSSADDAKDIYPIVAAVTKAFHAKDFEGVDSLLMEMDFANLNELSMVCLIRTTYCARHKLENWIDLRDRIAEVIPKPQRTLRGLYSA